MLRLIIGLMAALLVIGPAREWRVAAQTLLSWSAQARVPGYDPFALTPYLIADQNRTVHAFNTVQLAGQQAIVYSRWIPGQGWTAKPRDILLPQVRNQIRLQDVAPDRAGTVHLLFFSGDDAEANVYYASAPLSQAGDSYAWTTPKVVGELARTPDEAALVINSKNQLFALYSGRAKGAGLYFTYSTDQGATWSEPSPMFLSYDSGSFPFFLRMYVDGQDGIHALWNVNNSSGLSEAFYYAKLEAGQTEWRDPVQFEAGGLNAPALVAYEGELILVYQADSENGLTRYMRRSSDGGTSWTEPVRLFPHVGSNGPASFAVDSANVLHMFFGNRITGRDGTAVHGMWHTVWNGAGWEPPQAVVSGPPVVDDVGGNGFDPSFANAVISQGNVALVTWRSDPAAGANGVWYSYAILDTPELPVSPLPAQPAVAGALPVGPAATPTPLPDQAASNLNVGWSEAAPAGNPVAPVITGSAVAVLFVVVIVVGRGVLLRRR